MACKSPYVQMGGEGIRGEPHVESFFQSVEITAVSHTAEIPYRGGRDADECHEPEIITLSDKNTNIDLRVRSVSGILTE